jgi:SAM-dependent methyltransferase
MKPLSRLYLERRIRSLRCVVGGTVLDVGCGSGAFLDDMRALGWRSVGLEPDPNAARLARSRGAEVWEGTVETVSAPTALFDAVTMNHSLEHTHDPAAVIRTLCGWLKPGGVLWVAVPNFLSGLHRHYGRHWVALDPPRHLVHFTPQALRQLLEGAGLHVEWSSTVLPAEWTCFASEMVAAGGSPFRDPLEKTETAWQLAQKFDRSARADLSTADEIVMIGTRPQH